MLDWDDLRFFLAIARRGSLSAAAKDLHVAQSTVGRRRASLEASLSVRLLNRTPDGYVLTLAGQDVREQAERLEAEAMSLERNVGGRDAHFAGLVRVTCAETVASHMRLVLPLCAGSTRILWSSSLLIRDSSVCRCARQRSRYGSHVRISMTSSSVALAPWPLDYTQVQNI